MEKYLLMWPKSNGVTHINYHFSQFGEYASYLEGKYGDKILVKDGDIEGEYGYSDIGEIVKFVKDNNISKVAMHITYENAGNAKDVIDALKKEVPNIKIMGYGHIPKIHDYMFENIDIDALASSGHDQVCIESFFNDYGVDNTKLKGLKIKNSDGKFCEVLPGGYIDASEWTCTSPKLGRYYYEANNHVRYVLNVSTGCPFSCEHCLLQLNEGRHERRRTIESIDRDLTLLEKEFKYIEFFAANLNLDQRYTLELCKMIKEKHPNITWGCATRVDEAIRCKNNSNIIMDDADLFKVMHDAGCVLIGLGVEGITGNLETIHTKDFSFEKNDMAIRNIEDAGIVAKAMIMVRIPNQKRQDIINTFYYLTSMNAFIRPTIYTPYHKIDDKTNIYDLYKFNRKKIPDSNGSPVLGVSDEMFLQLLKDPSSFKEILGCTEEELEEAREVLGMKKGKVKVLSR